MATTELDELLAIALRDPSQVNFFYDTFLNTNIFVPVKAEGTEVGEGEWRRLDDDERFHPLFLKFPNVRAVPVFDELERLMAWGSERPMDYIEIRAHAFIKVLDPGIAVLLNPGEAEGYPLMPEVLEKLRVNMKVVQPQ